MKSRIIKNWSLRAALLLLMLTCNGCVYWRLNQFRMQLSDFGEHFRIVEDAVPVIISLNPVLKPDDLGWLSGLPASETRVEDGRTTEIYHYIKQYENPADDEEGTYDLVFPIRFSSADRLAEVQVPARFSSVLSEKNFDAVFGPMKDGTIEHAEQRTGWWWDQHKVNIPNRTDILFFFGRPTATISAPAGAAYVYRYQLRGHDQQWNPTGAHVFLRFVFEPEEERVIQFEAYKGKLHVTVDLRAERNLAEIKRL
jgi:hypothetical protein